MGPEATSEYFVISSTIQSTNSSLYLNIGTGSALYLPLSFDPTSTTTAWALEGDTTITANGSKYGRRKLAFAGSEDKDLIKRNRAQLPGLPISNIWIL
jgi:hypothetical protein